MVAAASGAGVGEEGGRAAQVCDVHSACCVLPHVDSTGEALDLYQWRLSMED